MKNYQSLTMNPHRVTINYQTEKGMATISVIVPAYNDTHAICIVIGANDLDGKVIANRAELLTSK